jgi:NADPH:quinone reductase-like Zn-dependent oxidoreductase
MKAVVIREFKDPKLLSVEEVPTPEPSGKEVLVAVKAASIMAAGMAWGWPTPGK